MRSFAEAALVGFLLAGGTNAAGIDQPQAQPTVQEVSQAIPKTDVGDLPPPAAAHTERPREVSREGSEYLRRLRKNTPFGTNGFDLAALRAGMGTRREPSLKGVKFIRTRVDEIPCEWVL